MPSTYLSLHVHMVFATHDRQPLIADTWRRELHAYVAGTIKNLGAKCVAVGGVEDHVHILACLRGNHATGDLVREVKKASSGWAKQNDQRFAWQEGYGGFAVSPSDVGKVTAYISRQEEHHRHVSSADELRTLLTEAGIEIDERFFV